MEWAERRLGLARRPCGGRPQGKSGENHWVRRESMLRTLGLAGGVVAGVLFMTGCASLDVGDKFNEQRITEERYTPVAHINGDCWGIYFLPFIPLLTGDTATNGSKIAINQDTVNVGAVTEMVTRKSKALGATNTVDLSSRNESTWIIPFLFFWYKECQVSGNAVK